MKTRHLVIGLLVANALIAITSTSAFAANLVKNGNANKKLSGWNVVQGNWEATDNLKHYKGLSFYAGASSVSELCQDISLANYREGTSFVLSGMCSDYEGKDICVMRMSFLDKYDKVVLMLQRAYAGAAWKMVRVEGRKPSNSVKVRISLIGVRKSGSDNDAYFDNVKLSTSSSTNLLINGSGEYGIGGWFDSDDAWTAVSRVAASIDDDSWHVDTSKYAQDGDFYIWPSRKDLPKSSIYQDIKIDKKYIGRSIILYGWMSNYNQNPTDKSTISLTFYDKKGKKISSFNKSHKSPSWKKYKIKTKVPKKAVLARVTLSGDRYNGNDLDSYFDGLKLTIEGVKY